MNPEPETSFFESLLVRIASGRVVILFLFHAAVFVAAYAFANVVRFDFAIPPDHIATFKWSLPTVVGLQLAVGLLFGYYRGWWRYVGVTDVVRLVLGLSTTLVLLIGVWFAAPTLGVPDRFARPPRGVLLIDWAFALLTLFGARLLIRMGRDRFRPRVDVPGTVQNVLIIGAGDAGETLAREIQHRPQLGMKVVAFVDDQRAKIGSQIRGVRVYGPISRISHVADEVGADEALIAIPSASGKRIREIIQHLADTDLKFKTMPGIDHLVTGRVAVTQLRPVNVEDLLRRKRIDLPGDPVRSMFSGKRVLITGAGGTIGSELASQIIRFEPSRLALVERSEYALYEVGKRLTRESRWAATAVSNNLVNICDFDTMAALIRREKPQIVVHAAAHKHVPLGEQNPAEYLRNNALATRQLAQTCADEGVERFVFISTDKAINPTSVMGATKRAAEILLLDLAARTSMTLTAVRFGNVIGSSGSVIPLFVEQIAAGGPVTVTHPEVTRYFIRTSEAISLVLQAATLGDRGSVFMLDMGEPLKIVDLARDLIRLSNHTEAEIPITFTGLRPGEKLFEEIKLTGEATRVTVHPQIVVTEPPQPRPDLVKRWLQQVLAVKDNRSALSLLSEIVDEYRPASVTEAPQLARADASSAFEAMGSVVLEIS